MTAAAAGAVRVPPPSAAVVPELYPSAGGPSETAEDAQEERSSFGALSPLDAGAKPDDLTVGSLKFNDGSVYKGTLKSGAPHGLGTCVWADGNNYDGEWRNGLMHGFGTYIWTSGQRYDGEWKDGCRHGVGVKAYADGSVFDGFWCEGRKHGVGVFRPQQVESRRFNVSQSLRLRPGNNPLHEIAERSLGPRLPKLEEQNPTGHLDTRFPPDRPSGQQHRSGEEPVAPLGDAKEKPHLVRDSNLGVADSVLDAPAAKGPLQEKKIYIRKFVNGQLIREEKLTKEEIKMIFGDVWKKRENVIQRKVKKALKLEKKLEQRQGQLVYKGMAGYDLMVRLQLGIRISIGEAAKSSRCEGDNADAPSSSAPPPASAATTAATAAMTVASNAASTVAAAAAVAGAAVGVAGSGVSGSRSFLGDPGCPVKHTLLPEDFKDKCKIFFPAAGSHTTPAHPSTDFKWKDYAPKVFHDLRVGWGCHDAEYMLSLGGSSALWQLNSPGKSGCLFFLSDDEKFLIKTMRKTEIKVLLDMLPQYYKHMSQNPESLVPKYFGVHGVKQLHGRTVRFVVMSNIFCTDVQIQRKFDLKGSTQGRTVGHADPNDTKTVFKDLDLDISVKLAAPLHKRLVGQIDKDSRFLSDIGVMDYSLLLGIHYPNLRRADESFVAGDSYASSSPLGVDTTAHFTAGQQTQAASAHQPHQAPHSHHHHHHHHNNHSPPLPQPGQSWSSQHTDTTQGVPTSALSYPTEAGAGLSVGNIASVTQGRNSGETLGTVPAPGNSAPLALQHTASKNNFDLYSNREEVSQMLVGAEQKMRKLGYDDERIADILGLAKLKMLGDKLHQRQSKTKSKSSTVFKAVQQARKDVQFLEGVIDGNDAISEDGKGSEQEGSPVEDGRTVTLGINMPAIATPLARKHGNEGPGEEEVVLFLGIIDILQDYNIRKVLERGFKSIFNDKDTVSVASPRFYSTRFNKFMQQVFVEDNMGNAKPYHSFAASSGRPYKSIPEEGDAE